MKTKDFVSKLDDQRIVDAIAEAEKKSSGEIRVYISDDQCERAVMAAQDQFLKLGMEKTKRRNGVLIFFAPLSQTFAIVGDQGIHEKCGQPFWEEVRDSMSEHLKQERFTEAVIVAVGKVGALLAKYFPPDPDDTDELPNQVLRG
ncbi:MAG: TPM domain-containing protein [Limisphaerales bacterium]